MGYQGNRHRPEASATRLTRPECGPVILGDALAKDMIDRFQTRKIGGLTAPGAALVDIRRCAPMRPWITGERSRDDRKQRMLGAVLHQAAFSLVELLVVIAVIGILAGLLLPALSSSKERARRLKCLSNLRQVNLALRMYADSDNDKFPQVTAGSWAWDVPWKVGDSMVQNGATQRIFYCPCSGFSDQDNLNLWNYATNVYRVVGYAMTFPGTATVSATNQNPSMIPQAMTDPDIGVTYPPQSTSERVLMADAVISQPGDADEIRRWLNTYINIQGGYPKPHRTSHLEAASTTTPAGGNVGMLDGHVEWRKFMQMSVRTEPASPYPVFWW